MSLASDNVVCTCELSGCLHIGWKGITKHPGDFGVLDCDIFNLSYHCYTTDSIEV